jgi:hypothetical protein
MAKFYSDSHRWLQDLHQSRALADRPEEIIVHKTFTEDEISFIEIKGFLLPVDRGSRQPSVS